MIKDLVSIGSPIITFLFGIIITLIVNNIKTSIIDRVDKIEKRVENTFLSVVEIEKELPTKYITMHMFEKHQDENVEAHKNLREDIHKYSRRTE